MQSLTIQPISYINGVITLPGSKSISNRVLLLAALSQQQSVLTNLLVSDDIYHMLNVLKLFDIKYQLSNHSTKCIVKGDPCYFNHKKNLKLFIGNAGTVMRPLSALLSLMDSDIILTGNSQMKKRPIKHLVDALRQGGANIDYLKQDGYPPIRIKGGFIGGNIILDGRISSQYLTALLIAAPLAYNDTIIQIYGGLISKPYIDMTLTLIHNFGVKIKNQQYNKFYIKGNQQYISPGKISIEGDASSASYFLAAAAIKGGTVKVKGINKNSLQGDTKFAIVLKKMGAKINFGKNFIECQRDNLLSIDMDMNKIPDAAMTIAIVALFAKGETIIRNIYNWRVKETNRLTAMSKELIKIGANVKFGIDYIRILPPKLFKYSTIETYNDHRIAMCFSLIALSDIPVIILNPNCISKTFPDYFNQLEKISYRY
ncbi:3-phosphoshikimate 1-carboxyvinyltransferase [Candidatus Arsenophonus lipoptenae]|uniref:3-phosphoshikimate 1-carboxyvinyltransferase n=1 Tax=Candidatus Arsenophonus lipoptenae TaxID=634113 RepID=A0A0X9VET9_9GAMM|nr:3-phosphoshikimate 1-carboxyvinyltransferase [Candidatus Arsenophonus lipoptenae]AMA65124.1 3-phosphoshikimate 1-carboxyvinyltransferase [Candidatus Arsenophonus lipoptenae]